MNWHTIAIVTLCIIFSGCNRHLVKDKSIITISATEKISATDTSINKTVTTTEGVKLFGGDTLAGSIFFENPQLNIPVYDSLESAGIKVKGTLIRTREGYKLNILAESKKVAETYKTTIEKSEYQGKHLKSARVQSSTKTDLHKNVQTNYAPGMIFSLTWIFILLAIALIIWKLKKTFLPFS